MSDIACWMRAPQISLCMIVRDEERFLRSCLESLRPWIDELCIVDTGSTDSTVAIAREFGAEIAHVEWTDDFSAARNASLAMATREWILVVDADEQLAPNSGPRLRELVTSDADAFLVSQDNRNTLGELHARQIVRFFRNGKGIEFRRPVHESVVDSIEEGNLRLAMNSAVHLLHEGYLPDVVKEKSKRARNERILRRDTKKNPENLYSLHKLAMMLPADCEERLQLYERAFLVAEDVFANRQAERVPYLPRVYANFVAALIMSGDLCRALRTIGVALGHFPGVCELQYQQADLALRLGQDECAQQVFFHCLNAPAPPPEYPADPSMRGLAAAIGVARAALAGRRLRDALGAVRKVRLLAPKSGVERALTLETLALSGQHHSMLEQLSLLMESELVHMPCVQLFIGDHAWSQGDHEAAIAMWKNAANSSTDVGQDALCRVAVAEACVWGRDAEQARDSLRDWSLEAASCRVVLAMMAQQQPEALSPALAPSAMMPHLMEWLEMVSSTGRTDVMRLLASMAVHYEDVLPGIEGLIVCDPEELAS